MILHLNQCARLLHPRGDILNGRLEIDWKVYDVVVASCPYALVGIATGFWIVLMAAFALMGYPWLSISF
jgi:hypothetical protein